MVAKAKVHFYDNTDMGMVLEAPRMAKDIAGTKVIATIGPSCQSVDQLVKLLEAGMTCARVDLTCANMGYHQTSLRNLGEAMKQSRRLCAVCVDTVGRELCIRRPHDLDETGWPVYKESIEVKTGTRVVVTADEASCSMSAETPRLPVSSPDFATMCEVGDSLFIGRYLVNGADMSSLYLEVTELSGSDVVCKAQNDALLEGLLTVIHKEREAEFGMSSVQARLPFQSEHDKACIKQLAAEFEIDFLSLTLTCTAQDVADMRKFLDEAGLTQTSILAKIENRQGLESFRDILHTADGIILSRGNLGLDVAAEKMAMVQKSAIAQCNDVGRPVIITRVVDTMVSAPRCTRAEATDVANAVLDGVDAIMLGAETLRGAHPVNTVKTIRAICKSAEEVFDSQAHFDDLMDSASRGGELDPKLGSGDFGLEMSPAASRKGSGAALASPTMGHSRPSSGSLPKMARPPSFGSIHVTPGATPGDKQPPRLSKLESMASTAVRAASKIQAGLLVVYANSGRTASLVAKYRPQAPILTLVVPQLKSTSISWTMQGRSIAKGFLIVRGVVPMLAAPSSGTGDAMLSQAIEAAEQRGLVAKGEYVVCMSTENNSIQLKIVAVDDYGRIHQTQGATHDVEGEKRRQASLDLSRAPQNANGQAPHEALNPNPVPTDTLGPHEHVDAA